MQLPATMRVGPLVVGPEHVEGFCFAARLDVEERNPRILSERNH
jgi:hypothetical protein